MIPTPVRVRGKKRNLSLVKSAIFQQTSSAKRRRYQDQAAKVKLQGALLAMPTIQGLPQELLEIIFLYSMNISLARSAPDLGRKLSSKAVCLEFCMHTFFWTVDHKRPIRSRSTTTDPDIQSVILECKFFDWPFFLSYVQKAHDAFRKLRGKAWAKTGVTVPDATWFNGLWPYKFTRIPYLVFAEGFRIPEKTLRGPWTIAKTNLLYTLVSLGGEIDWKNSTAGETAKVGMIEAIREKNERAVAALAVLLGIARAITTDTIRYAVSEGGCDKNILRHLLFNAQILYKETPRETLDLHNPLLWIWADEEGKENGRGELIKSMLKRAEDFDLEFYRDPDQETDWRSIVPFPYSGDKFDARTVLDHIVRELLTMLYRNHGRRITRRRRTIQGADDTDDLVDQS